MANDQRAALRTLYDVYFPYFNRLFEQLTGASDPELVVPLINDTLFELWESGRLSESPRAIHEWLLRSVVRRAQCFIRLRTGPPAPTHGSLRALSIEERAVICLAYTGHAREQIAGILCISETCVDSLLGQARRYTATGRNDARRSGAPFLPAPAR
jgi:DNA-directed RNA polymerase specialized sigma24 family protein